MVALRKNIFLAEGVVVKSQLGIAPQSEYHNIFREGFTSTMVQSLSRKTPYRFLTCSMAAFLSPEISNASTISDAC